MAKKRVPKTRADDIFEDFRKNKCPKLTKVSSEGCRYHKDCSVGVCLAKYILENYMVYEKE